MAHMVAETLNAPLASVLPLSDSLYHKWGGNPFTLKQLLTLLHDDGALYFDHQAGSWKWDTKAYGLLYQGEDDLALILMKLQKLADEEQKLLKLSSCLGNRFDLDTVAALWSKSAEETAAGLMTLVSEGLLLIAEKENEATPFFPSGWKNVEFTFLHDHIQQAVYSLQSEEEKKERHFKIGSFLMEKRGAAQPLTGQLMAMMDHFNRSLELIQDSKTKLKLARLNLLLGRKAKVSAAYESARQYLRAGISLLPEVPWQEHYKPVTIETSLQDRPITIILPLPAGLLPEDGQLPDDHQLSQAQAKDERASFLENLVIYVEHSNGQKELIRPQAVEYAPGEWGLQFVVDHFSLFSILHIEGAVDYYNQTQTRRLYGQDRYETAVKIAQAGWKEGANSGPGG